MTKTGQDAQSTIATAIPTLIGAILAGLLAFSFFGFTIDDALIPVRYARHLASGDGYRFNISGAVTDGVTPLPYAFLLAAFAKSSAPVVLLRAKLLGVAAYIITGAVVGFGTLGLNRATRFSVLATFAVALPSAIHAASGLETSLATLLVALAAFDKKQGNESALFGGLAATFRPELLPAMLVLTLFTRASIRERLVGLLVASSPFAIVLGIRKIVFGHFTPLSLAAKPSDTPHGLTYAAAGLVLSGVLFAAWPNREALTKSSRYRAAILSFLTHVFVIVFVGGDWMPFARLFAPILPVMVLAARELAPFVTSRGRDIRLGIAALSAILMSRAAIEGRHVTEDRQALMNEARSTLEGHTVAALDIGWPSAVTEEAIVDLAGLTDPAIAYLPGGHTSKRVDGHLLLERAPDFLVLLTDHPATDDATWWQTSFSRAVEWRLANDALVRDSFVLRKKVKLRQWTYLLLERTEAQ